MLCREDLKGKKLRPEWSDLDVLAEVVTVATQKFEEESALKSTTHLFRVNNQEGFMRERMMREKVLENIPKFPKQIMCQNNTARKRKQCYETETNTGAELKKRKKKMNGPEPPPDMPSEMKNCIMEMRGSNIVLVIQKPLYWTDTNPSHNRLSMPLSQLRAEFLTQHEKMELNAEGGIEVLLIEPSLEISTLTLKKWKMKKTSSIYALISNWNSVVKRNNLGEGAIVQVWSFRVDSKPCLALVRVRMGGEGGSTEDQD